MITDIDRQKYPDYNDLAIESMKLMEQLSDAALLSVVDGVRKGTGSDTTGVISSLALLLDIGRSVPVDPSWLTSKILRIAMLRGLVPFGEF